MHKLGHLPYPQWELSSIWGYADTLGNEYALVGVRDGFNVVDVTNPANPVSKIYIYGAYSTWKEIKTWKNYAYVVHDLQFVWSTVPDEGVLIVDLDSLQTPRFKKFRPTFSIPGGGVDSLRKAHTIFVDENGVMYLFGTNLFNGGVMMFDVATDPWNPQFLGAYNGFYIHDGYVRNNKLYAAAINNGLISILDVTLKSNPQLLASFATPNQFAHNSWLSDDGSVLFTTDEVSGGFVAAYDISNLNNITELHKIRSLPGTGVIPHNVHVRNDFLISSYYTRGIQVVDAAYPDLLVETGYYDTSPAYSGNGFHGAWGVYPYLPSGNILVSDIENGLWILQSDDVPAARIFGLVVDSLTGTPLVGASITASVRPFNENTKFDGSFKIGSANPGFETFSVSMPGYHPRTIFTQFTQGNYDSLRIAMLPLNFGVDETEEPKWSIYPNPSQHYFTVSKDAVHLDEPLKISVFDVHGRMALQQTVNAQSKIFVHHNLLPGVYVVEVAEKSSNFRTKLVVP